MKWTNESANPDVNSRVLLYSEKVSIHQNETPSAVWTLPAVGQRCQTYSLQTGKHKGIHVNSKNRSRFERIRLLFKPIRYLILKTATIAFLALTSQPDCRAENNTENKNISYNYSKPQIWGNELLSIQQFDSQRSVHILHNSSKLLNPTLNMKGQNADSVHTLSEFESVYTAVSGNSTVISAAYTQKGPGEELIILLIITPIKLFFICTRKFIKNLNHKRKINAKSRRLKRETH